MKIPTFSKNQDPALRRVNRIVEYFTLIGLLSITLLVCCSCGSTKVATQLARDIRVDTVYLSNMQYDSIYIYKDHVSEHHLGRLPSIDSKEHYLESQMRTDTLFIKDVSVEYRYKLLKDTIRVVERDSIPYQVTVTEIKEINRPTTPFDRICRYCFFFIVGMLLFFAFTTIRKLF